MNNIEKQLAENVYNAIKEEDKEMVNKNYNAYRIYTKTMEGEKDNELFGNVLLKYRTFMRKNRREKE